MVFYATSVSICSGAMAERVKLWPFFLFAAILAGVIYLIVLTGSDDGKVFGE